MKIQVSRVEVQCAHSEAIVAGNKQNEVVFYNALANAPKAGDFTFRERPTSEGYQVIVGYRINMTEKFEELLRMDNEDSRLLDIFNALS